MTPMRCVRSGSCMRALGVLNVGSPLTDETLAVGVDAVETARIAGAIARHGARFLDRIFTGAEQAHAAGKVPTLAARFAAKEACAKALGTGVGPIGWLSVEVRSDARGKPSLVLHGMAQQLADAAGLTEWHLSITHTRALAIAFVVGYRTGKNDQ